jgi:hypothetical protein
MRAGPFTLALAGWLFMGLVMIFLYLVQRAWMNTGIVDEMNPKLAFFERKMRAA